MLLCLSHYQILHLHNYNLLCHRCHTFRDLVNFEEVIFQRYHHKYFQHNFVLLYFTYTNIFLYKNKLELLNKKESHRQHFQQLYNFAANCLHQKLKQTIFLK